MTNQNYEKTQNENVKVEQNSSTDKKNPTQKRKNKLQPVYAVLTQARRQFGRQVDQNTETKIKCIKANITSRHYPDALDFWLHFQDEANVLLDSKRFCRECKEKGLNEQYIAEHLVFEGKKAVANVLKDGVKSFGERVMKFNAPLFHDEEKLYTKETPKLLPESNVINNEVSQTL